MINLKHTKFNYELSITNYPKGMPLARIDNVVIR